ncbi:MAG: glycosyltransferase family 2 protein [Acidobacteria bacterium]|nr:glycosyltransferase family 2 protein [Acidobacteriota bacterium]MCA1611367.1 glycosyltransferase family 2 protein [Acidobacteriota bacterium]
MTPLFSVVVPTFERPETLFLVLDSLGEQISPPLYEVVVVDDGSRDETSRRLASHRPKYPFRFFSQTNGGPASARNRGVSESRGRFVLFLGDDTVPEPELLSIHAAAHAEPRTHPAAVLGYTTWPRGRRVSPFLHHINEYGLQFGYALIADPESVPFNFFYTSNISLPRHLLLEEGLFDTSFPHAAWEDIEIAYRLVRRGMKIVYRPGAIARHHHDITFTSFRTRQEKAGESAAIFYAKHPELGDFLAVPQALAFRDSSPVTGRLLVAWAALAERWDAPGARKAVDRVLREDYLRGLARRLSARRPSPVSGPVSLSGTRVT